ncbi:MAG: hypothetical protein DYG99_15925 [Bacteroidetes bacterium CHB5]|nr:hypothetical protein [Bacteroidetes bacterium CHB5]
MGDNCCDQLNALLISSSAVTVDDSRFYQCRIGIQVNNGASPDITNVKIEQSSQSGLYVENGSPVFTNGKLYNNGVSGALVAAGSPQISNSCLVGNTSFGINNTGPGTVNATNNWWGHDTGPFHATLNPSGLGQPISNNVNFTPWAILPCDFVPPPVITITLQPSNQAICEGDNVTFSTAATGDTGLQYQWQEDRGSGFTNLTNSGIYNGTNTSTLQLFNVPVSFSTYVYRCEVTGDVAAPVTTNTATLTVNAIPSAPTTTNSSLCGSGSMVLMASGGANGQYRWYTVSSGGTAIAGEVNSSYTTPILSITTTYYVALNNSGCESSRTAVTASILTTPSAPVTTGGSGCSGTSITLTASGGSAGQYRWYTVSTGGTPDATQQNNTFTTQPLTGTTSYYVSINNGTCEGLRTLAVATVLSIPAAPVVQDPPPACMGSEVTVSASGSTDGNYRWYDSGVPLTGEVNGTLLLSNVSTTKTIQVSIHDGTCESAKSPVTITVQNCTPPTVATTTATAFIAGIVTIDLEPLITDAENNIDGSSLSVSAQTLQGAPTILNQYMLSIDYAGLSFITEDEVTINVCDLTSLCTSQELTIELGGDINVFNAISPNGDGNNDLFIIQYIDILPETQSNKVTIYNRWGDVVFEVSNYNNTDRVFRGVSDNGKELPSGTYFYKIEFSSGREMKTGYLSLKR